MVPFAGMTSLLKRVFSLPKNILTRPLPIRRLTTTKCVRENYEGDGKTTVTILNRECKDLILIDSFSENGFRLNNGIFVVGPMATFCKTVLQWNVGSVKDITVESLSLFAQLEPKLDILVIGTGFSQVIPDKKVIEFLNSLNISTEVLQTETACATFNFLNAEGRCVAAAFIPPDRIPTYGPEEIQIAGGEVTRDQAGFII